MIQTTIDKAQRRDWDVIVAGSSFASMFFIKYLPPSLSVLVVEKGHTQPHSDQIENGISGRESFRQINKSGAEKRWVAHSKYGGNSNCWWACTPRFHPNDFRLKSRYGVGADWPVSYDDLEQAYCEVEEIMEVTGGGSQHILPRSRPFPYPPHTPSRSDTVLQAHSDLWFPQPTARSNGGRRAKCCNNGVCGRCPIDSKFTVQNAEHHFQRENCQIVFGTELRSISVENGTAKTAVLRSSDGSEVAVSASLIALGANAIFNAAILIRSGFTSPALGRYLHEQVSQTLIIDIDKRNYFGGTSITGHGYALYDGKHRSEVAGVLLENLNNPYVLRPVRGRWTERLLMKLLAEDLPQEDNRLTLEDDEVQIEWSGHSDYAYEGLKRAREQIPEILPFSIEAFSEQGFSHTESHIHGTTRMGSSKEVSVVDRNLRCHEASNVLALGAGVFPSCSPANPTLTLSALSILAARALG